MASVNMFFFKKKVQLEGKDTGHIPIPGEQEECEEEVSAAVRYRKPERGAAHVRPRGSFSRSGCAIVKTNIERESHLAEKRPPSRGRKSQFIHSAERGCPHQIRLE